MKLSKSEKAILNYIRHYPEWVNEVETLCDMRKAITYDADRVQTSPEADTILEIAIRIDEAQSKIDKVERALANVYQTDRRINDMRMVFCHGGHGEMKKHEFYALRRIFAQRLLELFGKENI